MIRRKQLTFFIITFALLEFGYATSIQHLPVPEQHVSDTMAMQSPLFRFWGDEHRDQYRNQAFRIVAITHS